MITGVIKQRSTESHSKLPNCWVFMYNIIVIMTLRNQTLKRPSSVYRIYLSSTYINKYNCVDFCRYYPTVTFFLQGGI